MFRVINNVFHVTRGDKGAVDISFEDYTFAANDVIAFNVYTEDGMNNEPVLTKSVTMGAAGDTCRINFTVNDTKLGNPQNERVTYWYEVTLNGEQTPLCFDEKGPKIFNLYPGGVD